MVALALIWWQIIVQDNSNHRESVTRERATLAAGYMNARIDTLRAEIVRLAAAPETLAALRSFDPVSMGAEAQRLTALFDQAQRIEIIPRGKAEVDLNGETPISFAALDVIKRAETQPFVGPEAFSLKQHPVVYAATPITDQGSVAGVLFAAVSMNYFYQPFTNFPGEIGVFSLQQKFDSTPMTVVMQYGQGVGSEDQRVRIGLKVPYWILDYVPAAHSTGILSSPLALVSPFAVALALLLAGVYFSFGSLFRAMDRDGNTLLDYVSRLVRGRGGNIDRYNLSLFQQIAITANRFARGKQNEPDASVSAASVSARTTAKKPPAESGTSDAPLQEESDDEEFLDISKPTSSDNDNFGIEVTEDMSPIGMGLELDPGIFRAYDIRGIVGTNLTEEVVYWIGRAFAAEAKPLQQSRVAIGRDGRNSSPALSASLAKGLTEGGVDVLDVGQVPTPLLYYATYTLDTGTGIMITGSHNPPDYNGLKMVLAGETLAEDRIQALLQRIERNELPEGNGEVDEIQIIDHYIERITDDVAVAQSLKVVVDCGNGVAGMVAPRLLTQLGCEVIPLYCDVDGNFPNHHPDPADPANLADLITVVEAEKADIGLAFDGDGDRLGVVTERGEIIWPDKLLMLFARDIVGRNPGADIIFDVKCSRHLNSVISEYGGRPIMWKTGHSHIKAKIRETGALLGGEFSGHICFNERWYGFDDALYSAARLLEIIGSETRTVTELFSEFPVSFTTPEIKVETTETRKFEIMQQLSENDDFGEGMVTTIDGIRVDYPDGWGLIRPSNTSPVLTLRFEADGQTSLQRIKEIFQEKLLAVDPELKFLP